MDLQPPASRRQSPLAGRVEGVKVQVNPAVARAVAPFVVHAEVHDPAHGATRG